MTPPNFMVLGFQIGSYTGGGGGIHPRLCKILKILACLGLNNQAVDSNNLLFSILKRSWLKLGMGMILPAIATW